MDESCEHSLNYLHSSSSINALKEALESLYRLDVWPANPTDCICHNFPCGENETIVCSATEINELRKEAYC